VRDLFDQVEAGGKGPFPYLALMGALVIPDVCGAMEAADGRATRRRYADWFDEHVGHRYVVNGDVWFNGTDCYQLRCSLLHQGSGQHPEGRYRRIVFAEPNAEGLASHCNVVNGMLELGIPNFTTEIAQAGRAWVETAESTSTFQRNYSRYLRRYPEAVVEGVGFDTPLIA
jgi:hypothetical protein